MNGVRRFDDFVLLLLLLYIMHFFRFIKNVAYYNIVQYFQRKLPSWGNDNKHRKNCLRFHARVSIQYI